MHQRRVSNITMDLQGIASTIIFITPLRVARNTSAAQRVTFWERMVDAWWTSGPSIEGPGSTSIYLSLIASRASAKSLTIRAAFFDPAIGVRLLAWYQQRTPTSMKSVF